MMQSLNGRKKMTTKDKQGTYWYMRLKEIDIFSMEFLNMEDIAEVGPRYCVIYIKLCVKSIKYGGVLTVQNNGSFENWVSNLARNICEEAVTTGMAIKYMQKMGIIEINLTNETSQIYIPLVHNNTGKSSLKADKKRLIDRAKRLELETEQELLEKPVEEPKECYGYLNNVYLTDREKNYIVNNLSEGEQIINDISCLKLIYENYKEEISDYDKCIEYSNESKKE